MELDERRLEITVRTDYRTIEIVHRVPRFHVGWQSVKYKTERFQLFGGIRTPYWINYDRPIRGRS